MPTNYLRPAVKSSAGNKVYFLNLINGLTAKIYNTSKQLGVTSLHASFKCLLHFTFKIFFSRGYCCWPLPIVGRNIAELYNLIGMFVNTFSHESY